MKLFRRVLVSVLRRKTSSLIILLITFLLGNVLAISLSITQSAQGVKDNLMNSIGGKIVLDSNVSSDAVKFMNDEDYDFSMREYYDVYSKLASKEYVKYADYNLHFNNMELVDGVEYELPRYTGERNSYSLFHGVENEKLIDEYEGKLSLIEGSKFTKEQIEKGDRVVLVSNSVTKNGQPIQIGDVVEVKTFVDVENMMTYEIERVESEVISYEVVGIFQPVENIYSDIQNYIYPFYVPNKSLIDLCVNDIELERGHQILDKKRVWFDSSLIEVQTPDKLKHLVHAASVYVEETGVQYTSTENYVNQLLGPIESFSSLADKVLLFALFAMTTVVGLISFYFIRDRKYEIGIYLSLGIKKLYLVSQIILETLIVGLLGVMLSLGSGKVISESYSSYLLNTTIETYNEEKDKYTTGMIQMDKNDLDENQIVSEYEVVFTIEDVGYLFVLSTSTLVLSSIFPLLFIIRLKPKNILLE